jgi:hypothetical protein
LVEVDNPITLAILVHTLCILTALRPVRERPTQNAGMALHSALEGAARSSREGRYSGWVCLQSVCTNRVVTTDHTSRTAFAGPVITVQKFRTLPALPSRKCLRKKSVKSFCGN